MHTQKPVVGYLLKTFPKLSETFILNEMLELERQGVNLHVFSLRRPQDHTHHPAVSQLQAPVTYIPSLLPEWQREEETALLDCLATWGHRDFTTLMNTLQFYCDRPEDRRLNEFLQGCYLARELEQLGIGHLHVHFANIPAATAEIVKQMSGIPFSMTAHAKDIYLTEVSALNRRLQTAEFTLTCTDYNRQYLTQIAGAECPIHLAYHGIDLARFTPPTKELSPAAPGPLQMLSVGRFCEKKGFPYLLMACHQLQEQGIDFRCRIVGYGPLQAALENQIEELGLGDRVTLVGKLTQTEVIAEYRRADVFVLPCQVTEDGDRDGIPNVLLEAMAMGLPVVSTAISGITELVEWGKNGLLVAEKDPPTLAAALAQLADDRALGRRLGLAGRRTVHQNFTLEQNVGQVKDYLLQALLTQSPRYPIAPTTLSPVLEALI
ncbi:MAG: glycosyltransferase family 4 protein [Leptolyngbya sp. SIOISBB]|nr:glycosyltransferase family 4 protein [Leptolyngbya sp. SIOISBB]